MFINKKKPSSTRIEGNYVGLPRVTVLLASHCGLNYINCTQYRCQPDEAGELCGEDFQPKKNDPFSFENVNVKWHVFLNGPSTFFSFFFSIQFNTGYLLNVEWKRSTCSVIIV